MAGEGSGLVKTGKERWSGRGTTDEPERGGGPYPTRPLHPSWRDFPALPTSDSFPEATALARDDAQFFLREGQQRVALGAARIPAHLLAKEENHKGEDQTETDREREWNDRHVGKD